MCNKQKTTLTKKQHVKQTTFTNNDRKDNARKYLTSNKAFKKMQKNG